MSRVKQRNHSSQGIEHEFLKQIVKLCIMYMKKDIMKRSKRKKKKYYLVSHFRKYKSHVPRRSVCEHLYE